MKPAIRLFQESLPSSSTESQPREDEYTWSLLVSSEVCSSELEPILGSQSFDGLASGWQPQHRPSLQLCSQPCPTGLEPGWQLVSLAQAPLERGGQWTVGCISPTSRARYRTRFEKLLAKRRLAEQPQLPELSSRQLTLVVVPDVGFPTCASFPSVNALLRALQAEVRRADSEGALESYAFYALSGQLGEIYLDAETLEVGLRLDGKRHRLRVESLNDLQRLDGGHLAVREQESTASSSDMWDSMGDISF